MNLAALKKAIMKAWRFMVEDIWDIEPSALPRWSRWGVKTARVVHLVFRGFKEDECPLHASALTFSTLMSIIPVLALSLALAKGLGDAETAKSRIRGAIHDWTGTFGVSSTNAPAVPGTVAQDPSVPIISGETPPPEAAEWLGSEINRFVDEAFEKIENVSFTALGGLGLVILVWMVIQVLGRVEGSFNRVWGVAVGRSVWRRFTDYLSILFILPVLIVASSSVPIVDFATRFLDENAAASVRAILGSGMLKNATVLVMTALSFTFVIMFLPNARVHAVPGLVGGLVAAILFLVWMAVCAAIQVGAARAGKIYGSFAVVPILLAWVYVSWQIVLFGAETAFAMQNCGTFRMEQGSSNASPESRILLALSVLLETAEAMIGNGKGFDVTEYAREHRVSVRLLQNVVYDLASMGLLVQVTDTQGRYVLLKSPSKLRIQDVLDAMSQSGVQPDAVGLTDVNPAIRRVLDRVQESMNGTLGDLTVEQLLEQSTATASPA